MIPALIPSLITSVALGLVIAVCIVGALVVYESRLDGWDRLFLAGLAGSMLMTTPGLFFATPFDAWAFLLSKACLAGIVAKRWGIPIWWAWTGHRRANAQFRQSATRNAGRLHDRMGDKL